MKKKLVLSVILSMLLMFTFGTMAFAEEIPAPTFSDDTMINEDNVYDVAVFLGLKASDVTKNTDNVAYEWMTVGELRAIIEESKEKPQVEAQMGSEELENTIQAAGYGTKEVYYRHNLSSASILFVYASGDYYMDSTRKTWTAAKGARLRLSEASPLCYLEFAGSNGAQCTVMDSGYSYSYLLCEYYATIDRYQKTGTVTIRVATYDVDDSVRFYADSYL